MRLTDFSASRRISDHIQDRMKTTAGTPFWMAPEARGSHAVVEWVWLASRGRDC